MPLRAEEILAHPAFHNVIWDLEPAKKGKCSVAKGRGGPFDIAYEIHGTGPRKIIVSIATLPFLPLAMINMKSVRSSR